MDMPLEVELVITAWDNAKKNCFDEDGFRVDPETGELLTGGDSALDELLARIDEDMMDLVSHYARANVSVFAGSSNETDDLDEPDTNNPEWMVGG
jgi:hypothetical protein